MSKLKMNTRGKILDRALKMFNERGIEYVGLRELAGELDIHVGNITYYFPTKDDLVFQLSLELTKKNEATIVVSEHVTMLSFLEMLFQVFQNHMEFRCLFLSFVHLMEQNKLMAESYRKTQTHRRFTIKSNIAALAAAGYLNVNDDVELDVLVSTIALISRFWISEAAVSFKHLSATAQISHYITLVSKLLYPYASAKGKKEINRFLEDIQRKPSIGKRAVKF
jgi:AcrR family transcriptional regulator